MYRIKLNIISVVIFFSLIPFASASATVLLEDNFSGTTINTSNWSVASTSPTNVTQNDALFVNGNNNWNTNRVSTTLTYARPTGTNIYMSVTMTPSDCSKLTEADFGYGDGVLINPGDTFIFGYFNKSNPPGYSLWWFHNGIINAAAPVSGLTCEAGIPFTAKLVMKESGGAAVFINGASSPNAYFDIGTPTNKTFFMDQYTSNATTTFDNVAIGTEITPPGPLVASPRNGAVFLQWVDNVIAANHVVEYKLSSASTWNAFSHPASSVAGITVTGLTNGANYDFRVSTISSVGQSDPTTVTSIMPSATAIHASNNQILSTGQSLSVGYNGGPALTTTQPYSNLMINSGTTSLISLVEPARGASGAVETISSALANMITSLASSLVSNYTSIVSLHGVSSTAYSGLKKGTAPYNYGMAQVSAARQLSLAAGKSLIVSAVTAIHGESDEWIGMTASQYEADLVEWQHDYETDVQALLGQQDTIPLFTDQMSSWTVYNSATPHTALGQYMAAKNYPNDIIVVAPKYFLDYSDIVHLTNYSYRRLGEYYGKVYKKVVIDGDTWTPLMPTAVERSANVIRATFAVPVKPLILDTTAVNLKTNYGFEYADDSSSATISGVQVVAPDTVQVTLSGTPTGANPKLRYAYTGTPGSGTGRTVSGSARGNLRDSDTTAALYQDANVPATMGNYLYNWALTFDEAIKTVTIPDAPTTVSATAGQGEAMVSFTPPISNGGTAITSYTVTSNPGNISTSGSGSPITVTGLSNSTDYTFTVTATNWVGKSASSIVSNIITKQAPVVSSGGGGDYSPPKPRVPDGGWQISATSTPNGKLNLSFNYGDDIKYLWISEWNNGNTATQINATSTIEWPQPKSDILYVKFCNGFYQCTEYMPKVVAPAAQAAPAPTPGFTFSRNLSLHMNSLDVQELQKYLNINGFVLAPSGVGSLNQETTYFGLLTYKSLIKFQEAHAADILTPNGLTKGTGYFGPSTRAFMNSR